MDGVKDSEKNPAWTSQEWRESNLKKTGPLRKKLFSH
jgi:hypothetical protein